MPYCMNCGKQFPDDAKFCPECGTSVTGAHPQDQGQRNQSYVGEVQKCPNCGEPLDSFMVDCPACGYEIRHIEASNAVKELASKLAQIESMKMPPALLNPLRPKPLEPNQASVMKKVIGWDFNEGKRREAEQKAKEDERRATLIEVRNRERKFENQKVRQKADLICNFPVPNTREDILEFVLLASSNIDYKRGIDSTVSKAWIAKLDQVYQKAEILFKDNSDFARIKEIYEATQAKIKKGKNGAIFRFLDEIGVMLTPHIAKYAGTVILVAALLIYSGVYYSAKTNSLQQKEKQLEVLLAEIQDCIANEDYDSAFFKTQSLYLSDTSSGSYERRNYWDRVRKELIVLIETKSGKSYTSQPKKSTEEAIEEMQAIKDVFKSLFN